MKLLISTITLAVVYIHVNDQPGGPFTPHGSLGVPAEILHAVKLRKWWEIAIASTLTVDQRTMLLKTLSPITPEKCIIYWNLQ